MKVISTKERGLNMKKFQKFKAALGVGALGVGVGLLASILAISLVEAVGWAIAIFLVFILIVIGYLIIGSSF